MSTLGLDDLRPAVAAYLDRCERADNGCLINPRLMPDRYGEIRVAGRRMPAHRAVAAVVAGRIPDVDEVARHSCDNRRCAAPEHIAFGTQSQNLSDCYERNRRSPDAWPRGEERPHAQLTEEVVCAMRRLARAGEPLGVIADRFGVAYSPTRMAVRGETWAHVTAEAAVPGRSNKKPNPHAYRFTRLEDAAQVAALVATGLSLAEVAQQLGISRHTAWTLSRLSREAA